MSDPRIWSDIEVRMRLADALEQISKLTERVDDYDGGLIGQAVDSANRSNLLKSIDDSLRALLRLMPVRP